MYDDILMEYNKYSSLRVLVLFIQSVNLVAASFKYDISWYCGTHSYAIRTSCIARSMLPSFYSLGSFKLKLSEIISLYNVTDDCIGLKQEFKLLRFKMYCVWVGNIEYDLFKLVSSLRRTQSKKLWTCLWNACLICFLFFLSLYYCIELCSL